MAAAPVLDSDVLIDYLRGAGAGWELLRRIRDTLEFKITVVTVFELTLGRTFAEDAADALVAAPCLMLTREAATRGGGVLRELRAEGLAIDVRDAMQAGICLTADAPLITRNLRHFSRVPGLQVSDPGTWSASAT